MNIMDAQIVPQSGRKGDGGTYLVVADDSEEFKIALRYGCYIAQRNRGHVGILYVVEDQDFQHWNTVEHRIKKELRMEAEKYIWGVAKTAHEFNGMMPSLYFAEGERAEALIQTIDSNEDIAQLILGSKADQGNHGPLLSYFMGKGLSRLRVPMVVVPGHLKDFS